MAFTFKGTYTKNRGDAVAAGTVDIVSKRGATLDTATLDENGSYELVISAEEGEVTVVETLDGVEARSYPVSVSRGSTTDTSRDIGYVGPAAQSGASGGLSPATPVTTTTMDNPVAGGDMTVLVFPADTAALAIAIEGDEFPRWVLTSDPADGLFLTDGTFDMYDGPGITRNPSFNCVSATKGSGGMFGFQTNGDLFVDGIGAGVVQHSPDGTAYRLKVANDGTLSTEVVTL